MKRNLFLIILTVTFSFLYAGEAQSQLHHCKVYKDAVITENKVNVRSSPGMSGNKIFQVNAGDVVEVLEICKEEFFADGAYAPWVKISCDYGTGYICSRWMSSNYVLLETGPCSDAEYLVYEYFYEIPENFNPDWDELKVVKDDFVYIAKSNVKIFDTVTLIPENENQMFMYPDTMLDITDRSIYSTGLKEDHVILIRSRFKYGAGSCSNVMFLAFTDGKLKKIISESAFSESGCYRKPYINFPKICYNVFDGEWVTQISPKKYDPIVVYIQKMNYVDGEQVPSVEEYTLEK